MCSAVDLRLLFKADSLHSLALPEGLVFLGKSSELGELIGWAIVGYSIKGYFPQVPLLLLASERSRSRGNIGSQ